jgi:hypothetical protein
LPDKQEGEDVSEAVPASEPSPATGHVPARSDTRWAYLPLWGALAALLLALVPLAHAATYKWVDEKGVVHYTDKIPPDQVNRGSTVLDRQARPVQKIDPALTPEQRRQRELEEEQKRALAKLQEEAQRRDRALMSSYTTESEIDLARSRALGTIDAQIESAQNYSSLLTKRRDELDKRKAALPKGQSLPLAVERELDSTESELARQAALIAQKQKERQIVVARYDGDKLRWRELRAISDANAQTAAGAAK